MSGNHDDDASDRSRLRWLLGAMALLAIPLAIIWWPGCRQYPPVTSKESLKLMKLLYSACNTKDPQRLAEVERRLAELEQQGKLSPEEKAGFDRIIGMAKEGNWEKAEAAAFKFAQDQVGVGHPSPDDDHHNHGDHKHAAPKKGKTK